MCQSAEMWKYEYQNCAVFFTEKKLADLPEVQVLPEPVRTHPATVEVELTHPEGENDSLI